MHVTPLAPTLLALTTLLCLAAPGEAQVSVWTVNSDGSGDFLSLQDAVDAASAGDIILAQGGAHGNATIDKGLSIVGDGGFGIIKPDTGPGALLPALRIQDLPADESVLISGFTVFVGSGGADSAVSVADCAGAVWLQDMFVDSYGAASLRADDSASLVIHNTLLQTNLVPALPDGTPQAAPGAHVAGASRAYGYETDMVGSHGSLQGAGNPVPNAAADGGAGLVVVDADVRLTGCSVGGGSGNSLLVDGCTQGGDGGAGTVTQDGPALGLPALRLRDSNVGGAFGGFFDPGCAPPPSMGPQFDAVPGSVTTITADARTLTLPGVVGPGDSLDLVFAGEPGDLALLLASTSAAPGYEVGLLDLHLDIGALLILAALPLPTGDLDVPIVMPALPPGVDGLVLPLQAVFVDGLGAKHASGPRALVVR